VKFFFLKRLSTHAFLAIIVVVMLLSLSTLGLLTISQNISSSGTITTVNVGVFSDSQCTQPLSTINWGSVSPGSTVSRTVYIKNTGGLPLTLSMSTSSWNPVTAGDFMAITWNRENAVLNAGDSVSAELVLTVDSDITEVTAFSVNIIISGTG
jgi:hypothetical protein